MMADPEVAKLKQKMALMERRLSTHPRQHETQGVDFNFEKKQIGNIRPDKLKDKQINLIKDPDDDAHYIVIRIGGVAVKLSATLIE
jgi:hypothetical protein